MLTALSMFGGTDFVYTAMEIGLNMWTCMVSLLSTHNSYCWPGGSSDSNVLLRTAWRSEGHSSVQVWPSKSAHTLSRMKCSLRQVATSLLNSFTLLWATERCLGGYVSSPEVISSATEAVLQGYHSPGGERCGILAMTPGSALWAGAEEAEIVRLCLLPVHLPACPRKRYWDRFKYLCISKHGFGLHVYVCVCRPLWMTLRFPAT